MLRRLMMAAVAAGAVAAATTAFAVDPAPNGIEYPTGWQDWRVIATSYRTDNNTIRAILGNDIAIEAARSGQVNPWPDGAVLGKIVWREETVVGWETAKGPGEFLLAEFMFKDAARWADTAGWGWARWRGVDQVPFGADNPDYAMDCVGCHTPVADRDHVFTTPVMLPQ